MFIIYLSYKKSVLLCIGGVGLSESVWYLVPGTVPSVEKNKGRLH